MNNNKFITFRGPVGIALFLLSAILPAAAESKPLLAVKASAGSPAEIRLYSFDFSSAGTEPGSATLERVLPLNGEDFEGISLTSADVHPAAGSELLIGAGRDSPPFLRILSSADGRELQRVLGYGKEFRGGFDVAAADVTGDGIPEIITGANPDGGPHVKVFPRDGSAMLGELMAFKCATGCGAAVAVGKFRPDASYDLLITPGRGEGGVVRILSNADPAAELARFFPFPPMQTNSVNIAAGDVDADGVAEILVGAGPGMEPYLLLFKYPPAVPAARVLFADIKSGAAVKVVAGNLDANPQSEIIASSGQGGKGEVAIYSGIALRELVRFQPFGPDFRGAIETAVIAP